MSQSVFPRLSLLAASMLMVSTLMAEDVQVDRDELASIGDQSLRFINYVGPHEFIDTLDQIRGIGRALGPQIDLTRSGEAAVGEKYRILHIVSPDIPEGLDADVFILGSAAAVDHIANLRTILAGYLETAYGFSGRDAYLVAEFATYYNAVYRGDEAMVGRRYKAPVATVLTAARIGLDTHYSNWPGQTEMLIPLRGPSEAPAVDTGAVTDEKVIAQMREEPDMGLDSRRDMVELREKELDKEQEELDERRQEITKKEEKITDELDDLENKEEQGSLGEADRKRREDLDEEKEAVEEEKAALEETQKDIDERTDDVMQMRDDIAEDQNTLMERDDAGESAFESAEPETPMWFLIIDDEGNGIPFGRVAKYNLETGRRKAQSALTAVRGRTLVVLPDSLFVIAGKEDGNSRVRPMLLDLDSLEVQREGSHDVFPGSLMTVRGSDIYLVTQEGGQWRLGKFNANLERTAVSSVAVEPWTSVSFIDASLFVQGAGGEILKLSASDLREEARLE